MSAFEVCITPTRNKSTKRTVKPTVESREPTLVSFGPFSGKSIVTFENVPVTKTARRILLVHNPTNDEIKVLVTRIFKPEYNVRLEWTSNVIPSNGQVSMEISWTPLREFACREILELTDSRYFKKDVTVIFKSIKNKNGSKGNKIHSKSNTLNNRPTLTLKMKSPTGLKISNNKRKSLHNTEKFQQTDKKKREKKSPLLTKNSIFYDSSPQSKAQPLNIGKENISPVSPYNNASALIDKFQFTPVGNKNPSKLDYLASFPTPDSRVRTENYGATGASFSHRVENHIQVQPMKIATSFDKQMISNTVEECQEVLMQISNIQQSKSTPRWNYKHSRNSNENVFQALNSRKLVLENTDSQTFANQNYTINKTFELNGMSSDSLTDICCEQQSNQSPVEHPIMNRTTTLSVNAPRPLSIIKEEDKEMSTSYNKSYLQQTFDVSPSDWRTQKDGRLRDVPLRKFSESMKDLSGKNSQRKSLANQGSMPNLSDMENLNSITENRYYDQQRSNNVNNEQDLNVSTDSAISIASTVDVIFNQNEILAASSRFNVNEIGTNSVKRSSPIFLKHCCRSPPSPRISTTPSFKLKITPTEQHKVYSTPSLIPNKNKKRLRKSSGDPIDIEMDTLIVDQPVCIIISPPKRTKLDCEPNGAFNNSSLSINKPNQWANIRSKKEIYKGNLTLMKKLETPRKIKQESRDILYNPDTFLHGCINPDPFAATTICDPFMTATMYMDEKSVAKYEMQMKKWLNALVSIPAEFDADCNKKIDVGHLFNEVCKKAFILAPTKEEQSMNYFKTSRMDNLRAAGIKLFQSPELSDPCCKVAVYINKNTLRIRKDRDLHLDVVMQRQILELLLNFNPLWLRIGLEVVFAERIPLQSNADIVGLSSFILHRLFRDKFEEQKYFRAYALSEEYAEKIKKFTLQKCLYLLLFLDKAKEKRIIKHNPCLFVKNSPYKETKEILIRFSAELLASVGDITRVLRRLNYNLTHKQTFLDEFNYAFNNLAVDLRDGVRLTRVMEIILIRDDLSMQLRVPAISRLQRIYNINLALTALLNANFTLTGNITAADIVDGHREKTLSLLWQIIYKFRAPKFNLAATTIQKWWRNSWLKVVIRRRIRYREEMKRNRFATVIQSVYRGYMTRKYVKLFREKRENAALCLQKYFRRYSAQKKFVYIRKCVLIIQNWYRASKIARETRMKYLHFKACVMKIQIWYRRIILARKLENAAPIIQEIKTCARIKYVSALVIQKSLKSYLIRKKLRIVVNAVVDLNRKTKLEYKCATKIQSFFQMIVLKKQFDKKKKSINKIQNFWKAYMAMKKAKLEYDTKKQAAVVLQRYFRGYLEMKKDRSEFLKIRIAVITLQTRFRAWKLGVSERNKFQLFRQSSIKIQRFYRSVLEMRRIRDKFVHMRLTIIRFQRRFRAVQEMRRQMHEFKKIKLAAVVFQRYYRARLIMKKERSEFLRLRRSTIKIQQKLRATLLAKETRIGFIMLRNSAICIQQRFRANCLMRSQRSEYLKLKKHVMIIQNRFRANLLMRFQREKYLLLKKSAEIIQKRFRAHKQMRIARMEYQIKKQATIYIQGRLRDYLIMKKTRDSFLIKRKAIITIQRRFRALKMMLNARKEYVKIKYAAIIIQSRFRANNAMKKQRLKYLELYKATTVIQRWYKAIKCRDSQRAEYLKIRTAAITLQVRYRARIAMKKAQGDYQKLMKFTIAVQRRFKANRLMRVQQAEFILLKTATILIQRKLRATVSRNQQRSEYLKLRNSVIAVQQRFRALCEMRKIKTDYENYRKCVIYVQRKYRAKKSMKKQRTEYLKLKAASSTIQRRFRANVARNAARENYMNLRKATLVIQQQYRAQKAMKFQRNLYEKLKENAIKIQRFIRAYQIMKKIRSNFIHQKTSAVKIQKWYRSILIMRQEKMNYVKIRMLVCKVQQKWKATLNMRKERNNYTNVRKAIIVIQRRYRAQILMKKQRTYFLELRYSTIIIQRRLRATIEMQKIKTEYLHMRSLIIFVQRLYKAKLAMRKQRTEFLKLKSAIIFIQQKYRSQILTKIEKEKFCQIKYTVIKIQALSRGFLARIRFNEMMTPEMREQIKQRKAAITIQRYWRGYLVRKKDNYRIKIIRARIRNLNKDIKSQVTVRYRLNVVIKFLKERYNAQEALSVLTKLENISRCLPNLVMEHSTFISTFCCGIIAQTIRSEIDKQLVELCSRIILNLARYDCSTVDVFQENFLIIIAQMLLRWCDKECGIFNSLCTLIWIFSHYPDKRRKIRAFLTTHEALYMLRETKKLLLRKENMKKNVRKICSTPQRERETAISISPRTLPNFEPDFGVIRNKPYTFINSVFAFETILNALHINLNSN